jgi:class 3 adenylate cyclase/CHASE2 domain-containing sensor protein
MSRSSRHADQRPALGGRRLARLASWLRPASGKRGRRWLVALALVLVATLVSTLAVHRLAFLLNAEQFVEDLRIVLLPAEPQHPDVVIVTLTEDTLARFPYREPVDRGFLADLLTTLESRAPRAIAMDILFDQPTEPEKDERLRLAIAGATVPLSISYVDDPAIVNEDQKEFLGGFVPAADRAFANFSEDPFDTARWIFPGRKTADGTFVPGFARAVAAKLKVPTPDREIEIAWRGNPPEHDATPFRQFPAHTVALLPPAWFKNKVILIGADYSITDRHRTPFAAVYEGARGFLPGIVIHAHSVAQLLDFRPTYGIGPWRNMAIVFVLACIGAVIGSIELEVLTRIGLAVVAVALLWVGGFALFHADRVMIELVTPTLGLAMSLWMTESLGGREARRQREFIRTTFSRYVSPKVVAEMIGKPPNIEGDRREMTFLFTDVAGFTTMSEAIGTQELADVLNAYLDGVCQVILRYDGTVDKFIGDAVFAIFNAPTDQSDHAERAVKCGLEIDAFAEEFRAGQNARNVPFGVTRVGIHTGTATIGNFGSLQRMEYTALGDAVNTASRLEGLNKYFGTRICASAATRAECPNVAFRTLGIITLKGKLSSLVAYEPLHDAAPEADYWQRYDRAYASLESRDPTALMLFEKLHDERPADPCVAMHLERLQSGDTGAELVMSDK